MITVTMMMGRAKSSGRALSTRRTARIRAPIITRPNNPIRQLSQNSYGGLCCKKASQISTAVGVLQRFDGRQRFLSARDVRVHKDKEAPHDGIEVIYRRLTVFGHSLFPPSQHLRKTSRFSPAGSLCPLRHFAAPASRDFSHPVRCRCRFG